MAAQRKRKAPVQRQQRTWTIPRMLLILGYGVIFAFLGVIFLMRQELQRVGIFGDQKAVQTPARTPVSPPGVTTQSSRPGPSASPQVAKEVPRQTTTPPSATPPSPRQPGEITADEKQALDDILRSKR